MFYDFLGLGRCLPHGGNTVLGFQLHVSRLSCLFERGSSSERSGDCSMFHVLWAPVLRGVVAVHARRKLIGKGIINLGIFHMIGKTPWICQSGILDIKRQLKRPDSLKDFPVLSSIVFQPLGERWLIKRRDLRTFGDEKQAWKIGRVQPLTQVNIL